MRTLFLAAASLLLACGSRTPLDLGSGPVGGNDGDAGGNPEAASTHPAQPQDAGDTTPIVPPPGAQIVPDGLSCYGEITRVHGLSCGAKSSGGRTCDGTLYCNGEVAVDIHCEGDLCHCVGAGTNDCYCHPPEEVEDSCGPQNCCWQ